ncbi:MAG: hypothetical protein JJE04_18050 [Acidobacteriia bacterium]|nr:hypothetical protein [Terriglobia bacterium]
MDPDRAAEQAAPLDSRQALWLECPLMPEDAASHAALARTIKTPLAIGESYHTCQELATYFAGRAMGYAQPDCTPCEPNGSRRYTCQQEQQQGSMKPDLRMPQRIQQAPVQIFRSEGVIVMCTP